MKYIYIDESGDLGFNFNKRNTSKYFLVTFLITESRRSIEKLIKQTHKSLRKKYKVHNSLHASREEDTIKKRFCRNISLKDCEIMMIYLYKKEYERLNLDNHQLYMDMINKLLCKFIKEQNKDNITIIISRRETNTNLNKILIDKLSESLKHKITINIRTPEQEKCLQAVDIISWSLFRKYEYGDTTYYNIFRKLIQGEYSYI